MNDTPVCGACQVPIGSSMHPARPARTGDSLRREIPEPEAHFRSRLVPSPFSTLSPHGPTDGSALEQISRDEEDIRRDATEITGGSGARLRPTKSAKQKRDTIVRRERPRSSHSGPTLMHARPHMIGRINLQTTYWEASQPAIRRRRLTNPHAGEGIHDGTVTAPSAGTNLARSQKMGATIIRWNAAAYRWFPGLRPALSSFAQMAFL